MTNSVDKILLSALNNRRIILASTSPRRKTLLSQLGLVFTVIDVGIDETSKSNENVNEYVVRMATEKAVAAYGSFCGGNIRKQTIVNDNCDSVVGSPIILAADTCISYKNKIIGKPENAEHGFEILAQLSGNMHQVLSAVCVLDVGNVSDYRIYTRVNTTSVEFKHLSDLEIKSYWSSGESKDKAGGYAIQGLGAMFIKNISGSYSAVMGMPLFETAELLLLCGIDVLNATEQTT